MKYRFILTIVMLNIFCLSGLFGQINNARYKFKEVEKKNIIKINLLSPFLGTLSLQHERIINSESSFQTGLYYFSGLIYNQQIPVRGISITTEYRYYLVDDAPRGIYLQPFFRIARFWSNDPSISNANFYGTVVGMVLGKQWIFFDKFSLDMYAGPIFTKIFFDKNTNINRRDLRPLLDGYWLRTGLTVGYYF